MTHASDLQAAFWVNGAENDAIQIADRGLQYGDGFFTTMAIDQFALLNWQGHWQRLLHSCQVLGFEPLNQAELMLQIKTAAMAFLQKNDLSDAAMKILITRGVGGKAYAAPEKASMNILFYFKPFVENTSTHALKVGLSSVMMPSNSFQGVKTLNRLENVLARTEALHNHWQEAIMLDAQKNVVCGTQSNLFIINGKTILTPALLASGIRGTARAGLISLLNEQGYKVQETTLTTEDVMAAEELFFSNAVQGVQAAKSVVLEHDLEDKPMHESQKIATLWRDWQHSQAVSLLD